MFKRPAIIYALELEIKPFRQGLIVREERPLGKGTLAICDWHSQELALVKSGVGGKNIRRALDALLAAWQPDFLVLTGFAGACDPLFVAGQVVVPGNVVTADNKTLVVGIDGIKAIAQSASCTMVTVTKIFQADDKRRLLTEQGSGRVVDMESGFFTAWAQEHNIPFLVVKAISDPFQFSLPSSWFLNKYFEKKNNREMLRQILRHPIESYRLKKLQAHCRVAAENLKTALHELF